MASEHLADGHRSDGGEEGDPEGRERILPLGDGEGGDHPCTEAGDRKLGDEFTAGLGIGAGQHGGERRC